MSPRRSIAHRRPKVERAPARAGEIQALGASTRFSAVSKLAGLTAQGLRRRTKRHAFVAAVASLGCGPTSLVESAHETRDRGQPEATGDPFAARQEQIVSSAGSYNLLDEEGLMLDNAAAHGYRLPSTWGC